jgi:hypothetical protein
MHSRNSIEIMKTQKLKLILAGLMGAMLTLSTQAALTPIFDFKNSPAGNQGNNGPWLLGNDFTVNSPVVINQMGAFNYLIWWICH